MKSTSCSPGFTCFTWTGGTATATPIPPGNHTLFFPVTTGTISIAGNTAHISGLLSQGFPRSQALFDIAFIRDPAIPERFLAVGNASITVHTPEPDALEQLELGLLGMGVIGLVEMVKRKLKLGT
jgi:hypothetical protein